MDAAQPEEEAPAVILAELATETKFTLRLKDEGEGLGLYLVDKEGVVRYSTEIPTRQKLTSLGWDEKDLAMVCQEALRTLLGPCYDRELVNWLRTEVLKDRTPSPA